MDDISGKQLGDTSLANNYTSSLENNSFLALDNASIPTSKNNNSDKNNNTDKDNSSSLKEKDYNASPIREDNKTSSQKEEGIFSRNLLVMGEEGMQRVSKGRVLVIGCGGVGGYVIEGIARGGIGTIGIVDRDTISPSNINRQIIALHSTIGKAKVEVMRDRLCDINPRLIIHPYQINYTESTKNLIRFTDYDYIVDAVDSIPAKAVIAEQAHKQGIPLISCLGTGYRKMPTAFKICDIFETTTCPLARQLRKALRMRNIPALTVLFSSETPLPFRHALGQSDKNTASSPNANVTIQSDTSLQASVNAKSALQSNQLDEQNDHHIESKLGQREDEFMPKNIGSISTVPSVAGLLIASHVLNYFIERNQ